MRKVIFVTSFFVLGFVNASVKLPSKPIVKKKQCKVHYTFRASNGCVWSKTVRCSDVKKAKKEAREHCLGKS